MEKREELPTWDELPELQLEEVKPSPRRSNPDCVLESIDPSLLDELFTVLFPTKPVQH